MRITRRTFQSALLLAACSTTLPALSASATQMPTFRHRLRYARKGLMVYFSLRVVRVNSVSSDVPFTLRLYSDAGGNHVLKTSDHISHAQSSHIVRGAFDMSTTDWRPPARLYGQILFAEDGSVTRMRRITSRRASSHA